MQLISIRPQGLSDITIWLFVTPTPDSWAEFFEQSGKAVYSS